MLAGQHVLNRSGFGVQVPLPQLRWGHVHGQNGTESAVKLVSDVKQLGRGGDSLLLPSLGRTELSNLIAEVRWLRILDPLVHYLRGLPLGARWGKELQLAQQWSHYILHLGVGWRR